MPKFKTRKTVAKRFKISGTGKIKRKHAHTSHLRSKEDASTRHRKNLLANLSHADEKRVRKQMAHV